MKLRFHWMMPKGGEVGMKTAQETSRVATTKASSPAALPDMEGWTRFARCAEEVGIESVLLSFSRYEPDTILVACAVGQVAKKLKFIVAYRMGLMQPATFVQEINTLSGLIDGRVSLNVVAGSSTIEQRGYGDFLDHDERYARAEEFLTICRAFWANNGDVTFTGKYCHIEKGKIYTPFQAPDRFMPEIYVSGHSEQAQQLALSQASCYLRLIDTPEKLSASVSHFRANGREVCLRLGIVCRPTHEEAVAAAESMLPSEEIGREERGILTRSDSKVLKDALAAADNVGWLNKNVWAGLVPYYGSSAVTLVGSYRDLADAFLEYKRIGVTQFIISGWPKLDEMMIFGREVLPLIRAAEQHEQ
ncbi:MAG TPA: LLM class flavin-dependent oxidoreductase [Pyrinomonadaceae bacterium]|nr:LLM class flavin-dependent oxidoreductase [Pyrinomonadaceae bacterium]